MSAHKYELMFIADPSLDERSLKKLTDQYLEVVTKEGGSFVRMPSKNSYRALTDPAGHPSAVGRGTTGWQNIRDSRREERS